MPYANNNDTQIYWEESGAGEPLLLIMGLGGFHEDWRRLAPQLSEKYRVIVFDNRGIGQSATSGSFSMLNMASDAKAVLESAGIESAHILGMSMGGMIAQEFALNYPEKVRSLMLAVTTCGGREAVLAKPEVLMALQSGGFGSPENAFWAMAPFLYDVSTPRSILEEDLAAKKGKFATREIFMAQITAIISWSGTHSRLDQITVPTLVLHGVNDQLIPLQNGINLAKSISNAKLVEIENAGHMFATDQPVKSIDAILSFLKNV